MLRKRKRLHLADTTILFIDTTFHTDKYQGKLAHQLKNFFKSYENAFIACNTQYHQRQVGSAAYDNVFADSLASELASVSGSVGEGFELKHIITVAG